MSDAILVIGANGMVGRRLVPMLAARNREARAASRVPAAGQTLFDWHNAQTHDPTLEGAAAIFVVPPAMDAQAAPRVGAFLARARAAGVRRVVLVSSMGAVFTHEPPQSDRKQIEAHVRDSGIPWTLLRPSGFMQNFSEGFFLPAIVEFGSVSSAAGDGRVAFVDAGDIARVAAAALIDPGHDGTHYDITGPEPLSFGQAIASISQAAELKVSYGQAPPETMLAILERANIPAAYAQMLVRDQLAIRDGEAAGVSDVVEKVTGKPPRSFSDFVAENVAAWRTA